MQNHGNDRTNRGFYIWKILRIEVRFHATHYPAWHSLLLLSAIHNFYNAKRFSRSLSHLFLFSSETILTILKLIHFLFLNPIFQNVPLITAF